MTMHNFHIPHTYSGRPLFNINITTATDCPDTNNAKPPLSGLCLRQDAWFDSDTPDTTFLRWVNNIVIRVYLKNIWPEEHRFNFSVITDWMAWARRMQEQHGLDIHFKLRIICGCFAPAWMRQQCGSFPLSSEGFEGLPGFEEASTHCVKFWSDEYLALWAELMQALSDQFDDDKYFNEVVMSATGPGTGEAMEFAISNNGSGEVRRDQYIAGGANSANVRAAIISGMDAMAAYQRTNIGIALTKYWHMENPTFGEIETTKEFGEHLASNYRGRAVLGNNGLRTTDAPDGDKWAAPEGHMWQLQQHYRIMRVRYGSRIYNQTASIPNMGGVDNLIPTLNRGLEYMTSLVELPDNENKIKQYLNNPQQAVYKAAYKRNE